MDFKLNETYKHEFQVTQEVYLSFQKCSNDWNPLHTDELFAKSKGFPDKVMYGNILNAFVSYFIGECLPTKNVIIQSQEIAFKNPVFMNEKLSFEARVSGIYESVNTVEFKYKFIKFDGVLAAKGLIQIGLLR
ncbi:MAG TPA: MaoC/PaaZ C-terminal domain-containing protein [Paludibacter sp.]